MDFKALERAQIEHEMAMWTEIVRREKPLWRRFLNWLGIDGLKRVEWVDCGEISPEMIAKIKRRANAPDENDPNWRVVDSAW